jgi:alpha-D-ribose 1-methylphosphonate 5-triphosphate synthase subunit PhnG
MENDGLVLTLSKTDLKLLYEVVAEVSAVSQVAVVKPANTSLVMMGVKDSVQEVPFYLGEVLITQCAVSINEICGYGFAMGDDPERAYCLAVIEAALQSEHPKTTMISEFIKRQAEVVHHEKILDYAAVRQTRVQFDSMQEA